VLTQITENHLLDLTFFWSTDRLLRGKCHGSSLTSAHEHYLTWWMWCSGDWEVVSHGKWIHRRQRCLLCASSTWRCTTELLSCWNTQVPLSAVLAWRHTAVGPMGSQYRGPSFTSTSQCCWCFSTFNCSWPVN